MLSSLASFWKKRWAGRGGKPTTELSVPAPVAAASAPAAPGVGAGEEQQQKQRASSSTTTTTTTTTTTAKPWTWTNSLCLDTDSYKTSHFLQYPPGTTRVFSYIESRGGRHKQTVFFGLQYLLQRYLTTPVTEQDVLEADAFWREHGVPFHKDGWLHVVRKHGGLLPLRIRAVPEGTVVPVSNALVTVENTCDECFWCTSWVETSLLRVWYPITVCTESRFIKSVIKAGMERTCDDVQGGLGFKLHDFGARGVSSQESAAWGGASHLVNFLGSDTAVGVALANRVYGAKMAGFSIPAAEHSTITSWGRDGEEDAYRNMVHRFSKPGAIFAVVSDSYDIHRACKVLWGDHLREEVIQRGGRLVVRPDSGDPPTIVRECVQILADKFGCTTNKRGFKVLNHVGVIQGDGINAESVRKILSELENAGFSADNVAFGMGGALLQKHHRDVQQFAMKCSHVLVNGQSVDVYKEPATDPGKKSKRGRLDLVRDPATGAFETRKMSGDPSEISLPDSALVTVYENGVVTREWAWDDVRKRAEDGWSVELERASRASVEALE